MIFSVNKQIILLLILFCAATTTFSQHTEKFDNSTYYLIRHSEKDRSVPADKNPELSKKGRQRALNWSRIFDHFKIDAVYSTNYKRTLQTAQYVANAKKLSIKTYDPFEIDYKQFLEYTKGKNVLIVGHSNTIPDFANKLIGEEIYGDIDDQNNANLYIVTLDDMKISHVLIKMQQN
ncbi:MAG: histidine phosphatase family protein [Bacteroidia bacterium]|nr:histidine phosphatase family protein [Bacteroidia bacterium]